jgi:hypothetical protein
VFPRLLALLLLLISSLLVSPAAQAQTRGPLTVVGVSHGVSISLVIPRRSYPRDALVQFTVTIRNVSRRTLFLQDWPPDWGGSFSPHILMRTRRGKLVYEEQLSTFLAPTPGTLAPNYVLRPRQALTRRVRFVLQAGQVQAIARVADGYTAYSAPPGAPPPQPSLFARQLWRVTTPFTWLTLTKEPPPAVSVSRSRTRIYARVHAASPLSGDPLYMDSINCWTGKGTMWTNQDIPWKVAHGDAFSTPIYPHCPSRQPWKAVVGWPNHRVAFVNIPDVSRVK